MKITILYKQNIDNPSLAQSIKKKLFISFNHLYRTPDSGDIPMHQRTLPNQSIYDNAERSLERKWKKYFGDRRPPLSFEPFNISSFEPLPVR